MGRQFGFNTGQPTVSGMDGEMYGQLRNRSRLLVTMVSLQHSQNTTTSGLETISFAATPPPVGSCQRLTSLATPARASHGRSNSQEKPFSILHQNKKMLPLGQASYSLGNRLGEAKATLRMRRGNPTFFFPGPRIARRGGKDAYL